MHKFWMCWVEGTAETRQRYEVEADARVEAERLCKLRDKPVYVLGIVAVCSPVEAPVKWEET